MSRACCASVIQAQHTAPERGRAGNARPMRYRPCRRPARGPFSAARVWARSGISAAFSKAPTVPEGSVFDANLPCLGSTLGRFSTSRPWGLGSCGRAWGESQMSGSFGGQLPMLVIIALVVLAAAGGAIYLVRRFGVGGKPEGVTRGRPSRLAMVDSASIIDGRKLVIVRRDNVEHLLLIGGATDVLIEPHISRPAAAAHPAAAAAPARGAPGREPASRVAEPEPAPRLATPPEHAARPSTAAAREIPLADSAGWPLQPDHAVRTAASEPHASEPVSPPVRAT